jgi:hypothetical protein
VKKGEMRKEEANDAIGFQSRRLYVVSECVVPLNGVD